MSRAWLLLRLFYLSELEVVRRKHSWSSLNFDPDVAWLGLWVECAWVTVQNREPGVRRNTGVVRRQFSTETRRRAFGGVRKHRRLGLGPGADWPGSSHLGGKGLLNWALHSSSASRWGSLPAGRLPIHVNGLSDGCSRSRSEGETYLPRRDGSTLRESWPSGSQIYAAATTWYEVNQAYTQGEGRWELFQKRS